MNEYALKILYTFCHVIAEVSPYLLVGFAIAGIANIFFKDHLRKLIGNSILKSILIGVPLPVCSCSVIPLVTMMRHAGLRSGVIAAFLIATPSTGIDSILTTYVFLDWPLTLIKVVASVIIAALVGYVINFFERNPHLSMDMALEHVHLHHEHEHHHEVYIISFKKNPPIWLKILQSIIYGFTSLLGDIAPALFVGLVIASILGVFSDTLNKILGPYVGNSFLSLVIVLAISLPMYVCATGSVPIAAAFLASGFTPGSAIVLLLAGPMTNSATLAVVSSQLGRKNTLIIVSTLTLSVLMIGYLTDILFNTLNIPIPKITVQQSLSHSCPSVVEHIIGAIFLLILLWHTSRHTYHKLKKYFKK